jgi:Site-specific recombinase XerD
MPSYQKYDTKQGKRWMFKVDLGPDPKTGRRRTTTKRGFLHKPDAEMACRKYLEMVQNGIKVNSNIVVKELIEKWIDIYGKSDKRRPQTVTVMKNRAKHISKALGYIKVKDLSHYEYQKLFYQLKDNGLSKNTLEGIRTAGNMVFMFAVKEKIIERDKNPALDIELPAFPVDVADQEEKIKNSYFERFEVDEFLRAAKQSKREDMYQIFFTLIWTGIRLGELVALRWDDVDFENHEIHIRRTYVESTRKENAPKTASSIRTINIEPELESVLHSQHAKIKELSITYPILKNNIFVFPQLKKDFIGKQYTENAIYHEMLHANDRCSFKKRLTPHKLRHTFTSLAAEAEVPLDDIRAMLGHHDDEITRKVYEHVTKNRRKKMSHKFGEFMRQDQ